MAIPVIMDFVDGLIEFVGMIFFGLLPLVLMVVIGLIILGIVFDSDGMVG